MAENGEENLLSAARQIAKTLGQNDSAVEEILQVFSKFDVSSTGEGMTGDSSNFWSNLDQSLTSLDRRFSQYVASKQPIWYDSVDLSAFLELIDQLLSIIRDWTPRVSDKSGNSYLIHAENLLNDASFRVEEEFKALMEHGGEYVEHRRGYAVEVDEDERRTSSVMSTSGRFEQIPQAIQVSDYSKNVFIDAFPSGALSDMREMVKRLVASGFEKRCCHVYSSCRKAFIEESLFRLGFCKFGVEESQRISWVEIGDAIDKWPKAANVFFKIILPSERQLCDEVFHGFRFLSGRVFIELCHETITNLMSLPYAVSSGSRSPERLFKILDLFDAMRDLIPEFELYANQCCVLIVNEVDSILRRLGEAIAGIFVDLENLISNDPVRSPVPRGGLHPITRYVMNYLRAACKSRQTLERIFDECIDPEVKYFKVDRLSFSSPWVFQIAWIMELLDKNLEKKSKIYSDTALSYVFMMNNHRYIVHKVKDSELGFLLGDDWFKRQNTKVRKHVLEYQRCSLCKILGVLKSEMNSVSQKAMTEKIKLFNMHFEDLCSTQSSWFIFDDCIGEDLRMSISENLLPAYTKFLGKFQGYSVIRKRLEKSINLYNVEDIENRIKQLFCDRS